LQRHAVVDEKLAKGVPTAARRADDGHAAVRAYRRSVTGSSRSGVVDKSVGPTGRTCGPSLNVGTLAPSCPYPAPLARATL
jgi:hypothetical protein